MPDDPPGAVGPLGGPAGAAAGAVGPPAPGFITRVGQAALCPGRAARRLCQGGPGGVADMAPLLLLRLLGSEGDAMARAARRLRDEGSDGLGVAAAQLGRQVSQAILPDLLLVVLAAVVLALFIGKGERHLRAGLVLDLSAQAWVGWLMVHVLASLAMTLLQHRPAPALQVFVQIAALCAFAVGFGYALQAARSAADLAAAREPARPSPETSKES